MKIVKLNIENYRLLKEFSMDLEKELSLVIGKNNTGKTSILSILDKFLNEKNKFSFEDLNIEFKNEFESLILSTSVQDDFKPIGIRLKIYIEYDESDDLSNISRILMDLDPENNYVVLGFEYSINQSDFLKLRSDYSDFVVNEKSKFENAKKQGQGYRIKSVKDFLQTGINTYFKTIKKSLEYDIVEKKINESNFIDLDKESISLKDVINFKYISAKREVTNKEVDKTLSKQTSSLYKKKEDSTEKDEATQNFKDQLSDTDHVLTSIYEDLFKDVIKKVKDFGGVKLNDSDIAIISTLQHKELLEGNTTVVYTHDDHKLPEHYNGLGYMNLISMIFEIEILVEEFKRDKDQNPADINLLFIEEPEAHTHPQMQYVFIKNIKKLLGEGIKKDGGVNRNLQYVITTHSSHIVADSDFDDIKYLRAIGKNNVIAKNLKDLSLKYESETNQYQFLKQYLTISRAEIFFADKAILIEGDTEKILIPTFMRKVDLEEGNDDNDLPLLSQNISIIEVGAYSQIFEKFIDFIGVKALILTDIDSKGDLGKKDKNDKVVLEACRVGVGTETSNSALNHFLPETTWNDLKVLTKDKRILKTDSSTICISYQQEENSYHARSFEDAFLNLNRSFVTGNKKSFNALKNHDYLDDTTKDAYELAEECIKKKTHFALDILYNSDDNFSNWQIPEYIKSGLLWLKED